MSSFVHAVRRGWLMALADDVLRYLRRHGPVLRFHADWIRSTFQPDIEVSALSVPRGSAKTFTGARILQLGLSSDSPLFEAGIEVLGVSASLEQSRIMLSFLRQFIADAGLEDDYRWLDSGQRLGVTHKETGTKLRILSSSGKRAMGLANFSIILADEPASWQARDGAVMYDALRQSLGKRSGQRLILIGTRAPAEDGSWWPSLLDAGSGPGTHVTVRSAPDDAPWDSWSTIRAVNPLVSHSESLRKTILRERDDARRDETKRPAFKAYRLNQQTNVYKDMLVSTDVWRRVESRPVADRDGKCFAGFDMGLTRSWSGCWVVWETGRAECYAVCGGKPNLISRERADAMPRGAYQKLEADGSLLVDDGLEVARPVLLVEYLESMGIRPAMAFADNLQAATLRDAIAGRYPLEARQTRWATATEDVAAFVKHCKDGPLSIAPECRRMARLSMSQAVIIYGDNSGTRVAKARADRSRDDIAVSATLAHGELERRLSRPVRRRRFV